MAGLDTYTATGRVVDRSTGIPVAGLHVRAYDRDPIWDDRLGNDDTDEQGTFRIGFTRSDFAEPFEGEPEVYVVVYDSPFGGEPLVTTDPKRPSSDGRVDFLVEIPGLKPRPRITRVIPEEVLPGTFVTVEGAGFGDRYEQVQVHVGGREALVLQVSPTRVRFRVPPSVGELRPLRLGVAGEAVELDQLLRPAERPDEGTVGHTGPPATFSGSQALTAGPDPVGLDQPVLVVLCSPNDKAPTDGGLSTADERQRQIDVFQSLVNPAFRQMSYQATDFSFDFTDWLELPDSDDDYFWRQADIDAAQAALDDLPEDATEEELDEAKAALEAAQDNRNLMQRSKDLYHDALEAAIDAGFDLSAYVGVMVCVATDHLRGQASGRWSEVTDSDDDTITLDHPTYLWVISYNAHWGRRIHELAHAVASRDLYGDTGIIATASPWDMMGSHNRMPLFSGHNIVDRLDWYTDVEDVPDPSDSNVLRLRWTDAPDHDETYLLRAHGPGQDTTGEVYNVIRLEVFPGLTYHVEVRQEPAAIPAGLASTFDSLADLTQAVTAAGADPSQLLYDTHLDFPGTAPAHRGGIIVTKVVDDDGPLNQQLRQITLLSPQLMQAGDEVVDAARRLTIRAESLESERPLTYRVRVRWQEVATADPNGLFNLRIRRWDASYQTNDIWVDSEANEFDVYESATEPATGNPLGNGDRPWVDHWNRIHARVYNFGVVDTEDVQVTFYVNSPPAIGDRGTWVPLAVTTIPNLAAGTSGLVTANWFPERDKHTCVKVEIETQLGETEVNDNGAQENVSVFNTEGSSPHQPVVLDVRLQNPLPRWAKLELGVRGLPAGWELSTEHRWIWLPPLGEKTVAVTLFTDLGRAQPLARTTASDKEIPPDITCYLEAGEYRWYGEGRNVEGLAEHLASVGGVQLHAHARIRAELRLSVDPRDGGFTATGTLTPTRGDKRIVSVLTGPDRRRKTFRTTTDAEGRFLVDSGSLESSLPAGTYRLQASLIGDAELSDTESPVVTFDVDPIIIE